MSENSDPWILVQSALEDSRWKFRTIPSVSRDSGLSEDAVRDVLADHESQIYCAVHPNQFGQPLYTTVGRAPRFREFIGNLQKYASKTPLYFKQDMR